MANINGKKPLSSKAPRAPITASDDIFGNPLSLDPATKAKLEERGLAFRFINAKKVIDMGGYAENGWSPIKMKDLYGNMEGQDIKFGMDPEGYVRRGDLVLAVRSKELNEKHKQHLRLRAEAVSNTRTQKSQADELRKLAAKHNVDMTIHEGFEEEEENN